MVLILLMGTRLPVFIGWEEDFVIAFKMSSMTQKFHNNIFTFVHSCSYLFVATIMTTCMPTKMFVIYSSLSLMNVRNTKLYNKAHLPIEHLNSPYNLHCDECD